MLIIFSSPTYADITMFGGVATSLIELMGHSATVPSAILAEDVPAALAQLKKGLKELSEATDVPDVSEPDDDGEPEYSLGHRAIPLIKMLETAITENSNVMWDKGS